MGMRQDTPGSGHKTQIGELLGTPVYMSPEQAKGLPADELSDVYSLGVVLYEILTGHPPFSGNNIQEILTKVIYDTPTPVREVDKDVSRELEQICEGALAGEPEHRVQAAAILARQVDRVEKDDSFLNPFRPYLTDLVPELKSIPKSVAPAMLQEAERRWRTRKKGASAWLRDSNFAFMLYSFLVVVYFALAQGFLGVGLGYRMLKDDNFYLLNVAEREGLDLPRVPNTDELTGASRMMFDFLVVGETSGVLWYMGSVIGLSIFIMLCVTFFAAVRLTVARRLRLAPDVRQVLAEWEVLGTIETRAEQLPEIERRVWLAAVGCGIAGGLLGWFIGGSEVFSRTVIGAGFFFVAPLIVAQLLHQRKMRKFLSRGGVG